MGVITHAMVSGKADGPNTSFVQPSDWDAPHVIAAGSIETADLGGDITTAGKTLLTAADAATQLTSLGGQPLDATLTALAGLDATAGVVEQTGPDAFTKRALGVGAATSVLTRADGDGRYSLTSHDHTGRRLARQTLTGSGTVTSHASATLWHVRMVGGGGGGGAGTGAGTAGAGGGNSGWYLEFWVTVTANTGYSYACGAAGTAGATTPTAGGTGGDTTLGPISAVTYTAKGGTGGGAATRSAAGGSGPAAPATGSSATDVLTYGQGDWGVWSTGLFFSGFGGPSPLGAGGYSVSGNSAGVAGTKGGGGSGASSSSTDQAGGAGGAGLIIIDEYT